MEIRESAEMYLETILILSKEGPVRSIDVARAMNFSRPSVSVKVHDLANENYISISENGLITLEPKGKAIADEIYERHTVLSDILEKIGVTPEVAAKDACKVEHVISQETFDCIKKMIKKHKENNFI